MGVCVVLAINTVLRLIHTDIPEFMDAVTRYTPLRFDIELFTQCVSTWDRRTEIIYTVSRALLLYL